MSRNGSLKRINKKLKKYYGYSYTDLLEVIDIIATKMTDCAAKVNTNFDEAKSFDAVNFLANNLHLCIDCFTEVGEKLLNVTKSILESSTKEGD